MPRRKKIKRPTFLGTGARYRDGASFGAPKSIPDVMATTQIIREKYPNPTIVDLACGTGTLALAFSDIPGARIIGVDQSNSMLATAKKRLEGRRNVSLVRGNASNLPVRKGSVDVITCRVGFHHFQEPTKSLSEMREALKHNGSILISELLPRRGFNKVFNALQRIRDPTHVKHYSRAEMSKMAAQAGLEITQEFSFTQGLTRQELVNRSERGKRLVGLLWDARLHPHVRRYHIFILEKTKRPLAKK